MKVRFIFLFISFFIVKQHTFADGPWLFSNLHTNDNSAEISDSIYQLVHQGKILKAQNECLQWIEESKKKFGDDNIQLVIPYTVTSEIFISARYYNHALDFLDEALRIIEISSGWMYPDYGIVLNYKVFALIQLGEYEKAESLLNEVEIIYTKTLGENHPDYNATNINWALLYQGLMRYDVSLSYFKRAMTFNKDMAFDKRNHMAVNNQWINVLLAKLYLDRHEYENAQKLLKDTEAFFDKNNRTTGVLYAELMYRLGDLHFYNNELSIALHYYNKYQKVSQKMLGDHNILTNNANFKLATVYKRQNYFNNAIPLFETVIKKYNKHDDDVNKYAQAILSLADIYICQGHYNKAKSLLDLTDDIEYNKAQVQYYHLRLKGSLAMYKGDFINAEKFLLEMMAFVELKAKHYSPQYTEAVISLVELSIILGRVNTVTDVVRKELNYLEKENLTHTIYYQKLQLAHIRVQLSLGKYEKQYGELDTIYDNTRKITGNNHYSNIKNFFLKGIIAEKNKQFDLAINFYDSADHISEQLEIIPKEYHRLHIINARALIYLNENNYLNALKEYQRLENVFSKNSVYYPSIQARLAYVHSLNGNNKLAEDIIIKATQNRLNQFDQKLKFTSEDEKINFIHNNKDVFIFFNSIMMHNEGVQSQKMINQCYNIQLNYRKFFLTEEIKRKNRIRSFGNYRTQLHFTDYAYDLAIKRSQLSAANFFTKQERDSLHFDPFEQVQQINNLEKSIVYASADIKDSVRYTNAIKWESIKNNLSEGEVAIEIIKLKNIDSTKDYYGALLLSSEAKNPKFVVLNNADLLENEGLNSFSNSIYENSRSFKLKIKNASSPPYEHFWLPIKNKLKELNWTVEKIYLSNDGIFNSININVLKNPETEKYVIEEDNISIVTSTASIKKTNIVHFNQKKIVLMGNPIFSDLKREQLLNQRGSHNTIDEVGYDFHLPQLPGTEKEVIGSSKIFKKEGWDVTLLTQETASEKQLKNLGFSPTILHIATHGFYLEKLRNPVSNNSLLKSGLFFSEISKRKKTPIQLIFDQGNDGILTAYEVKNLDLHNTELLVLSACQTGLSDLSEGDGISGLQYAFSIAGVKSIIMSLWSVDDEATQQLMKSFYEEWFKTKDKTKAFQNAQILLKKKFPEPYYWGAFVIVN
ncbi:CHAT domain-containing protein [Flammeovirga sp. SubArs3]|uniref:CHAT domain-containing protein n=1 Tax=Flammeovirga sp. SubArs3 TaxID=2995316 RepID=UPI00248B7337|nr:CHAT domain-containing protein [Flammeovirga sp. SubArs3]